MYMYIYIYRERERERCVLFICFQFRTYVCYLFVCMPASLLNMIVVFMRFYFECVHYDIVTVIVLFTLIFV